MKTILTGAALAACVVVTLPAAAQVRLGDVMTPIANAWAPPALCKTGDGADAWHYVAMEWKLYHQPGAQSKLRYWELQHGEMREPDPRDYACVVVPSGTHGLVVWAQAVLMLTVTLNGRALTGAASVSDWQHLGGD